MIKDICGEDVNVGDYISYSAQTKCGDGLRCGKIVKIVQRRDNSRWAPDSGDFATIISVRISWMPSRFITAWFQYDSNGKNVKPILKLSFQQSGALQLLGKLK